MRLLLVRHGLSLPKEVDPERGLSEAGKKEVERIAETARGYGVKVSAIRQSAKKLHDKNSSNLLRIKYLILAKPHENENLFESGYTG